MKDVNVTKMKIGKINVVITANTPSEEAKKKFNYLLNREVKEGK